jgi:hypothetical protein
VGAAEPAPDAPERVVGASKRPLAGRLDLALLSEEWM